MINHRGFVKEIPFEPTIVQLDGKNAQSSVMNFPEACQDDVRKDKTFIMED
jgi:hypothetical protein